jgi:hypothetical protein
MDPSSMAEVAGWLSQRFTRLPDEYESGREEMASGLAEHLSCSVDQANQTLDELERAGYLRYAAEARSIGGTAGKWIIYTSPAENPEDELLDRAVPEQAPGDGAPRPRRGGTG